MTSNAVPITTKPVSMGRIVSDKTEIHVESIPANVFSRELLRPIDTGFVVVVFSTRDWAFFYIYYLTPKLFFQTVVEHVCHLDKYKFAKQIYLGRKPEDGDRINPEETVTSTRGILRCLMFSWA